MRLTAGLRPDPLGELWRSPDPIAVITGEGRKGKERVGNTGIEKEGTGLGLGRDEKG